MLALILAVAVGSSVSLLLITIAVGVVIPALIAFITKESLPQSVKALILLLLSTASGVIAGLASSPPANWSQWEQVLVAIFVTFVAAVASEYGLWKPSGAQAKIQQKSSGFGIG